MANFNDVPAFDQHLFFGEDKNKWEGCQEFVSQLEITEIQHYIKQADNMAADDSFYAVRPPAFKYILEQEFVSRAQVEEQLRSTQKTKQAVRKQEEILAESMSPDVKQKEEPVVKPDEMAKQLHIINDKGTVTVRELYNPAVHGRFNSTKAFGRNENSPFLEHVMAKFNSRYIQFTAHAFSKVEKETVHSWLSKWAHHGARIRTGENKTLEYWKFLYGHYTDKGSMIMIPSDSKIRYIDDIGVHVHDAERAAKRFKRVTAPHQYSVFGKILHVDKVDDGSIVEFELESGYVGLHRNIELESLPNDRVRAAVDGQNRISVNFLREVGVKDRDLATYGCKMTAFNPIGLTKGYAHAQEGLKFDIVSYGTKTEITYDDFFFGILGGLKPGDKFKSDSQSMTNFEEYYYALEGAQLLMKEIADSRQDIGKLRGMLLARVKGINTESDEFFDELPDEEKTATENWMLINALQAGMDPDVEPSLIRRSIELSEVMQCDKGRIPFDFAGVRCDAVPDPHMFDEYGDVHLDRSIIPAGHVVSMDVPVGPIVAYRQPNGMALEHSQSMNVHMRQFEKFSNRRRAFYGPDLLEILEPMNGADLDDILCIIHDPRMVKRIRSLTYPVTEKMVVISRKGVAAGKYVMPSEALFRGSYTAKDFDRSMERDRTMTMVLGQVVLAIMLDTLLSGDHKANMIAYLSDLIQNEENKDRKIFYLDKREWLINREDYQLKYVATNLEKFIDYCVMGRGDASQFNPWMDLVNEIKNTAEVYPFYFSKEGTGFEGQGRISPKRKLGEDYILAPSLLCKALREVELEREGFLNDLRAYQWECITPLPMEMEYEFPFAADIHEEALTIRNWFNPKVVAAMSDGSSKQRQASYKHVIYGRFHECVIEGPVENRCPRDCKQAGVLLEEGLKQKMEAFDYNDRLLIAVEMKRIVHRNQIPKYNDNGTVKAVPDGVFGNNIMFNYYLDALDKAGLTGKYVFVDLDQVSSSLGVKNQTLDVHVVDGVVLRKEDDFYLGVVDADNGDYRLVNGMLEIRKPDISITSVGKTVDSVDEDGSMPNAIDFNF